MATVVYCGIWIAKIYKNIIIQKAPDINKRASSEAATGPGILEQNTERQKGAYAPGGHGG